MQIQSLDIWRRRVQNETTIKMLRNKIWQSSCWQILASGGNILSASLREATRVTTIRVGRQLEGALWLWMPVWFLVLVTKTKVQQVTLSQHRIRPLVLAALGKQQTHSSEFNQECQQLYGKQQARRSDAGYCWCSSPTTKSNKWHYRNSEFVGKDSEIFWIFIISKSQPPTYRPDIRCMDSSNNNMLELTAPSRCYTTKIKNMWWLHQILWRKAQV